MALNPYWYLSDGQHSFKNQSTSRSNTFEPSRFSEGRRGGHIYVNDRIQSPTYDYDVINFKDRIPGSPGFSSDGHESNRGAHAPINYVGRGPKGWRRSDELIKEEVCMALERDPYIDASEIEVDVREGVVSLRGAVDERRTKRLAEDCVESIRGVKDVRNELSVNQSLFDRAKAALLGR